MAERAESDAAAAEGILRTAVDPTGRRPLPWAAGPLLGVGRVLDLWCGAGALADELPAGHWLGADPVAAPLGRRPRIRATPTALPLRAGAADGIALLFALPRLPDIDEVFAELRRVLRPGGTLVLVVPSAQARSRTELRLAPLLAPVHRSWPHRSGLDRAGWLLAAADFAVLGDDRVSFALPIPDARTARDLVDELPRAAIWPPDLPAPVRERVAAGLARRAGPGRVLPLPLRRLVARR